MTTLKTIDKQIASFTLNRNKLRDQAQEIALMIFRHAAPTAVGPDCAGSGDCTRALKLVAAMPTSWGTQMVAWFKAFTPIRMNVKAGNVGYAPEYKKETDVEKKMAFWNLEDAAMTPFYDATEEAPVRDDTFSLATVIKLIQAIESKAKKAEKDGKVPDDQIEAVRSACSLISRISFVAPAPVASNDTPEDRAGNTQDVAA